jgi:hypothetical protein
MIPVNYGLTVASALLLSACLPQPSPAKQASDAAAVTACVTKDWGQPIVVVAADCFGGVVTLAEDGIADLEALFETQAATTNPDAGAPASAAIFPYNTPAIRAKVDARRAAIVLKH